jgi:hypothetical protein
VETTNVVDGEIAPIVNEQLTGPVPPLTYEQPVPVDALYGLSIGLVEKDTPSSEPTAPPGADDVMTIPVVDGDTYFGERELLCCTALVPGRRMVIATFRALEFVPPAWDPDGTEVEPPPPPEQPATTALETKIAPIRNGWLIRIDDYLLAYRKRARNSTEAIRDVRNYVSSSPRSSGKIAS